MSICRLTIKEIASTDGTKFGPVIQTLYVECKGVATSTSSTLSIDYISSNGELDYYHQDDRSASGTLKLDLDQIEENLTYPIFKEVEGLIQPPDFQVTALSDNVISMLAANRTQEGLEFQWQNTNPTEFALKIHIGNPPVIGSDGIIYGFYEIMDLASTPLTPAGGSVDWVTKAAVPAEVTDCYILLSVESRNMRLYVNYAVELSDI